MGRRRSSSRDASSGPGLARILEELGCRTVLWPTGGRSKQDRLETHLGTFAEGRVLVRAEQPWTVPLVREWAAFPNARHDDQVDTITQYLDWWATHHLVRPVVMGAGGRMVRAETMLFA